MMSAADTPNIPPTPTSRQLPPADLFLAPRVAAAADWVGRTQVQIGEFFVSAYQVSCDASSSLVHEIRTRSRRIKEENPMALLAGIAGAAFALGVATQLWRFKRR